MKNLIFLVLLSVLSTSPLHANMCSSAPESKMDNAEYLYTIHVGAFVRIKDTDFLKIRSFGFMYAEDYDKQLKRIYMGDYATEAEAKKVLAKVQANGYPDAYVTRRSLAEGKEVAVIQLGTARVGDRIKWEEYAKAGPVMVQANGKDLKIVIGTYPDVDYARARIGSARKAGFKDAFVRPVNNMRLHRVTRFETRNELDQTDGVATFKNQKTEIQNTKGRSSDEVPVKLQGKDPRKNTPKQKEAPQPEEQPKGQPDNIPQQYDELAIKSPSAPIMSRPEIRAGVKRNSVIELQKALKGVKAYQGSLDGFYGKGTAQGYQTALNGNREIQKYRLLVQHDEQLVKKGGTDDILQHYINTLPENTPQAIRGLETTDGPIAKVYRAYALFRTSGDQGKIDYLMNLAIKEAFEGVSAENAPPFDHRAKYTYQNPRQLLTHLRHVQGAADPDLVFPCWLFQFHPKEMAEALKTGDQDYKIEDCDALMEWEELRLLEAVASDLNPSGTTDAERVQYYAAQRARLYFLPAALSTDESKRAEAWHSSLWKGLNAWEKNDPLHTRMLTPFRIAYYQSMVGLEDHFMDEDFEPAEARSLAVSVLKTIIAPHMKSYLR